MSRGAEWGGDGTKDRWCLNTLNAERAGECVKKINRGNIGVQTSAMVHTHANWSMAAPHGTSLDRLHHLNSMSNLTIHRNMLEQTHPHTHS